MKRYLPPSVCAVVVVCMLLSTLPADTPTWIAKGNTWNMYTSALQVSDSGVVSIPSRYRWSIETGMRGIDANGKRLPDGRILLRLHDPDHNFSCFIAQMDLATAAKLHHDLGEMLIKKLEDPGYMYKPKLYRPDQIPTKRIIGIDAKGNAILEEVKKSK